MAEAPGGPDNQFNINAKYDGLLPTGGLAREITDQWSRGSKCTIVDFTGAHVVEGQLGDLPVDTLAVIDMPQPGIAVNLDVVKENLKQRGDPPVDLIIANHRDLSDIVIPEQMAEYLGHVDDAYQLLSPNGIMYVDLPRSSQFNTIKDGFVKSIRDSGTEVQTNNHGVMKVTRNPNSPPHLRTND